jgi:ribonuclease VapC
MAWLKGQQPTAGRVRLLFQTAERREHKLFMNIVNLGEVFYLCAKARDLAYGERVLQSLLTRIGTVSATDELVLEAAKLKAKYPISYADAFAVVTAMLREAPLVTGDPELLAVAATEKKLKLEWLADR